MGTLVGQRYGLGRNYTGSLVELNNCGYSTNTCEDQFDDMKSSTEQSWSSEPSDLSVPFWMSTSGRTFDAYEAHLETSSLLNTFALDVRDFSGSSLVSEKSDVQNTKHLLGVTQLIGLSRLMKFIMHKSRQWNTNDNMSENPHSSSFTDYIFAQAQLKQKARRRGHYPILQTFSHSSSLNASLTCIAEPKYTGSNGQCTQNLLETFTYTRCKRRHYNSESGLFLPEANFTVTQHQNEKKSECESDSRLSKDILSSGYPEEANCSMLPTDINTNDTNSEVAVSQNECQENYLLSGEREIDALTVNAIENFAQCLPETVSEGSTCSDQLQEMNSLPNLTKSNDSTVNQITLHDEHQVFTNNLSDKSIVATSQSKLDLKLIKSVSFADEIGKSLTETFIVYDEDCYDEPPAITYHMY
ncbi:unnamed protein product [Heterobilharzia americana]|nr:unnamed protein product [Heterobilharzia americana]